MIRTAKKDASVLRYNRHIALVDLIEVNRIDSVRFMLLIQI